MEAVVVFSFISLIAIVGGICFWFSEKRETKEQGKHSG